MARVETTYEWADKLNEILKETSKELKKSGISRDEFELIQRRKLLEMESKVWDNREIAKLYKNYRQLIKIGTMPNLYEQYRSLNNGDFQNVVHKYLSENQKFYMRRPPSWGQMSLETLVLFGVIFGLGLPLRRRLKRTRK